MTQHRRTFASRCQQLGPLVAVACAFIAGVHLNGIPTQGAIVQTIDESNTSHRGIYTSTTFYYGMPFVAYSRSVTDEMTLAKMGEVEHEYHPLGVMLDVIMVVACCVGAFAGTRAVLRLNFAVVDLLIVVLTFWLIVGLGNRYIALLFSVGRSTIGPLWGEWLPLECHWLRVGNHPKGFVSAVIVVACYSLFVAYAFKRCYRLVRARAL